MDPGPVVSLGSLEGLLAELQGDYAAAHFRSRELFERANSPRYSKGMSMSTAFSFRCHRVRVR